jgi:hypothetical protein
MGLVSKNGREYFYRSKRIGGRVQTEVFSGIRAQIEATRDEDGHVLMGGPTDELMRGCAVRVLVRPETTKEAAIVLLRKIIGWIERDGLQIVASHKPWRPPSEFPAELDADGEPQF